LLLDVRELEVFNNQFSSNAPGIHMAFIFTHVSLYFYIPYLIPEYRTNQSTKQNLIPTYASSKGDKHILSHPNHRLIKETQANANHATLARETIKWAETR
jgi:uncharacterized circularly permuted ATP-grasp superfamily protein